jgi:nucleoside-diphosphate-sugar epimerase
MAKRRRVLITGHNGYIGSVMARRFLERGYDVVGLDNGYFRDCTLVADSADVPSITRDIRDLVPADVRGFDAVVHLAALSNDPIGNLRADWTEEINFRASVRLAELAREAGVPRFLFSSSCIMYGMSATAVVTEDSPLDPKTEYARSKVKAERAIAQLADERFSPTFLRNGTIYGLSPRMRFDTVLNDLVGAATTTGKVTLYSDGQPWRPVIHVQDVARAFLAVLEAPVATVHNQAFNTGANHLNHQVIELAEIAVQTVPGTALEILAQPGADQRTYRADFAKFARTFPDFEFQWTAKSGAEELYRGFSQLGLDHAMFVDQRFTRLKWLRHLLDTRRLDETLRWAAAPGDQDDDRRREDCPAEADRG